MISAVEGDDASWALRAAHTLHGGRGEGQGVGGRCAQGDDLGKSSRGGKARGGLEGSEPPREARTRAPAPPPLRSPRWSGLCSPVPPRPPLLRSPVSSLSPARNHLGPHIGDLPAVPNTCLPAVLKTTWALLCSRLPAAPPLLTVSASSRGIPPPQSQLEIPSTG